MCFRPGIIMAAATTIHGSGVACARLTKSRQTAFVVTQLVCRLSSSTRTSSMGFISAGRPQPSAAQSRVSARGPDANARNRRSITSKSDGEYVIVGLSISAEISLPKSPQPASYAKDSLHRVTCRFLQSENLQV
ncbi:hypothetical protein AVR91_0238150 [Amycolatopsis keratiniphila subsp. keratiniphila]|uniref:Uncharacterized protein n=1 Tax=Amycolatopsis keratiniphila subsp. keratiniphila TaxID=227715 RepID=A0A1W2LH60_9PSEU|nr:hypothetical protein AVR91_0238150 [Amycolatopsis keratiniphila subsp. keratiniphila]